MERKLASWHVGEGKYNGIGFGEGEHNGLRFLTWSWSCHDAIAGDSGGGVNIEGLYTTGDSRRQPGSGSLLLRVLEPDTQYTTCMPGGHSPTTPLTTPQTTPLTTNLTTNLGDFPRFKPEHPKLDQEYELWMGVGEQT